MTRSHGSCLCPEFIKTRYFKRFGKGRPDVVRSIEATVAAREAKKQARKVAREGARLHP